jgi:hypothetical protein
MATKRMTPLGNDVLGRRTLSLLSISLAFVTCANYDSNLRQYYCFLSLGQHLQYNDIIRVDMQFLSFFLALLQFFFVTSAFIA